jgi:hypothetical protein
MPLFLADKFDHACKGGAGRWSVSRSEGLPWFCSHNKFAFAALQGAKLSFFWVQLSSSVVGQGVRVQATINWLRL